MRRKKTTPAPALPRATPAELLRLLIPAAQARDLVMLGKTADAVANATRCFGKLRDDGLEHLASTDIIVALAELDLRAKALPPELIQRVHEARAAIAEAEEALAAARSASACASADLLVGLGYREAAQPSVTRTGAAAAAP